MGNSDSISYDRYNSNGKLTTKTLTNHQRGWAKIIDITSENKKEVHIKVKADSGLIFLHNNPTYPLILKKNHVAYDNIRKNLDKNKSIYVDTGESDLFFDSTKVLLVGIADPKKITASIIFGYYSKELYDDELYRRLMPPDVFSINKIDLHTTCEKFKFLVPLLDGPTLIYGDKYEISAVNAFDSDTYIVTGVSQLN